MHTPQAAPAALDAGLSQAEHQAIREIADAPSSRVPCPAGLRRLFKWTDPTVVLHVVPIGVDSQVLVIGEPENGAYEWAVSSCTDGRITQRSDDGYGSPEVALRDGLIAVLGLPSPAAAEAGDGSAVDRMRKALSAPTLSPALALAVEAFTGKAVEHLIPIKKNVNRPAQGERPAEPHPSRCAPKCAECAHAWDKRGTGGRYYCRHPAAPVSLEDGRPTLRAEDMRRYEQQACGPAGKLFSPAANVAAGEQS